jgi:hypothetical protein
VCTHSFFIIVSPFTGANRFLNTPDLTWKTFLHNLTIYLQNLQLATCNLQLATHGLSTTQKVHAHHEFVEELRRCNLMLLVNYRGTLRACAPEYTPSSNDFQFKLTKSQQLAKQPAVAIETKATEETATFGRRPGVPHEAMSAPQTVPTIGNASSIFDPTRVPGVNAGGGPLVAAQDQTPSGASIATDAEPRDVPTVTNTTIDRPSIATATKMGHGPPSLNGTATAILLIIVVALLGSVLAAPVGLFGDPERRMVGVFSILLSVVSLYLKSAQCCSACTANTGQLEGNAAHWISPFFRTFVSIDTMMAAVELILQTVAFDACIALCPSVCQVPASVVVGVFLVHESENSARKTKVQGQSAAVRRHRWRASPSALVFFALALFCALGHGWVVFTPNANQSAQAKEVLLASFEHDVSLASFEHETNGTVLCVPGPIIHPSWDEIDPTGVVGQGLCPEGKNEGTVLKISFFNC